tara:strand:+ start:4694 stop:5074 length:381 start_codon:yes stop_codon:yes gene_type:complete
MALGEEHLLEAFAHASVSAHDGDRFRVNANGNGSPQGGLAISTGPEDDSEEGFDYLWSYAVLESKGSASFQHLSFPAGIPDGESTLAFDISHLSDQFIAFGQKLDESTIEFIDSFSQREQFIWNIV